MLAGSGAARGHATSTACTKGNSKPAFRSVPPRDQKSITLSTQALVAVCRSPETTHSACNCCEDIYGEFKLGNVYEYSLEELLYSEHHVQVVKDLIAGRRDKYDLCRKCPQSPTGPSPDGKRIGIVPRQHTM